MDALIRLFDRPSRHLYGATMIDTATALSRNNVKVRGIGARAMLFAHGFGCDQTMWRLVAPHFESNARLSSIMSGRADRTCRHMIQSDTPT
jgi:hypothetical protein